MPTDDERREAARRLRGQAKKLGPNMDAHEFAHYTADVLDAGENMTWYEMELRLADLIEPDTTKQPEDTTKCDRKALLDLSDEMQSQAFSQLLWTLGYVDVMYLIYYARRIREALGVADD